MKMVLITSIVASLKKYLNGEGERIAAFESEDEMVDFINDIGRHVYAD